MAETIYLVATLARQIQGEVVLLRSEKAFRDPQKAQEHLKIMKSQYVTAENTMKPVLLSSGLGDVQCICEAGIFEVELE